MVLHAPTDDERYLAQPRPAPVIQTALGWLLGALLVGLVVSGGAPFLGADLQSRADAIYTGVFGAGADGASASLRVTGVVVFGLGGLLTGFFASFLTDLIAGVPKQRIGAFGNLVFFVLWTAAAGLLALTALPLALPVVGLLYGWVRAGGFGRVSRILQAFAWLLLSGGGTGILWFLMWARPDLATVIRFG